MMSVTSPLSSLVRALSVRAVFRADAEPVSVCACRADQAARQPRRMVRTARAAGRRGWCQTMLSLLIIAPSAGRADRRLGQRAELPARRGAGELAHQARLLDGRLTSGRGDGDPEAHDHTRLAPVLVEFGDGRVQYRGRRDGLGGPHRPLELCPALDDLLVQLAGGGVLPQL